MSKDYEILNKTNIDFNKYEVVELNDLEKKKMQRRLSSKISNKSNKRKNRVAVAVIAFAISGGVFFNSTVVQATIEKVTNKIEDFFGSGNNVTYDDYTKVVGTTTEDKGIKITLNEVLIKEDRLIITINVDSANSNELAGIRLQPEVYINGENIKNNGILMHCIYNDDGTIDVIQQVGINQIDINRDLEVEVKYTNIEVKDQAGKEKELRGKWEFSFKDNVEAILKKTKSIEINKAIDLGDGYVYNINELKLSPIDIILKYNSQLAKLEGMESSKLYDIKFTFTDINRTEVILEAGGSRRGENATGDCQDISMLKSEVADKILLVPYKDSREKYETAEEAAKHREYFWDNAIEIDIR
ncbi:DUF4179 domain-containing protein [Clostridium gasigenes]|uniref:DUF4179 domain-containing protein n=1 Tax=Clostridium gasigenes TaxID=94869 RepID=UPI001C0CBE66|nr:DUF4179 domain-containing protein [Clostridium gasigenes]MBU3137438.1 DUF4179 domain-containing protein [Clostridium gasigenes]